MMSRRPLDILRGALDTLMTRVRAFRAGPGARIHREWSRLRRRPAFDGALRETSMALPFSVLYALALGGVVALGVNLSNASPSENRPFGWPGPSTFDNGVAMVRDDLVVATALPALLFGLTIGQRVQIRRDGAATFSARLLTDCTFLFLGAFGAGLLGMWAAATTADGAYVAFSVSSAMLGISFYAVGVAPVAVAPRAGPLAGGFLGLGFLALYESYFKLRVFRELGYHGIMSGAFPTWFYVAQVMSPVSTFRALLITWRPQFRDWAEQAALNDVVMPAWVNPWTFAAIHVFLWIVVPLEVAIAAWMFRSHAARRSVLGRTPSSAATPAAGGGSNLAP